MFLVSSGVYPFTVLDYWTGTLDWTTGLASFWFLHILIYLFNSVKDNDRQVAFN